MLDMARRAHEPAAEIGKERYDADWTQQFSLIRSVEIIGEAARRVSAAGWARLPSVPWHQIVGTRNRVAHDYMNVDLELLWRIVMEELPPLVEALEQVVPPEPPE